MPMAAGIGTRHFIQYRCRGPQLRHTEFMCGLLHGGVIIHWLTQRFWPRLYREATKWQQDDGLTWAASLAYYGAFSFFPLVLVILAGAGLVLSISSSLNCTSSNSSSSSAIRPRPSSPRKLPRCCPE